MMDRTKTPSREQDQRERQDLLAVAPRERGNAGDRQACLDQLGIAFRVRPGGIFPRLGRGWRCPIGHVAGCLPH
jgi:hypothetical protein